MSAAAAGPSVRGARDAGLGGQDCAGEELAEFVAARTGARAGTARSGDGRGRSVGLARMRGAIGPEAGHAPKTSLLMEERRAPYAAPQTELYIKTGRAARA